jgi:hypothetical protein
MNSVNRYFLPLVLVCLNGIASAQQGPDAIARAKAIAPLIDEVTVAVLHADLTRIQAEPLLQKVAGWIPEWKSKLETMAPVLTAPLEGLRAAGVTDVYAVVSVAGPLEPNNFLFFVVPLSGQVNESDVTQIIRQALPDGSLQLDRIGGALVIGLADTLARLRDVTPDERPELAVAFAALEGTAVQAVLLPPKHTRRVIEEIMPELPEALGGGPSSILTNGILWAAAGADLSPKLSFSAVIQSREQDSAKNLLVKWGDLRKRLVQAENVTREIPNFERLLDLLTPQVRDSRLILQGNEDSEVFQAVLEAVRAELVP